jgi:hypothetical protein
VGSQQYLKKIEETVTFLKKEGMGGTAKFALDTLSARVEDAKKLTSNVLPYIENGAETVLTQVNQAWTTLTTYPQGEPLYRRLLWFLVGCCDELGLASPGL